MQPLTDLRVLDLSRLLPGGLLTQLLANLGAAVLKVEEPGRGDYMRFLPPLDGELGMLFRLLNRGKRSMTLNLKASEGRDILLQLVQTADVLVESFRAGTLERLGLGTTVLREANPALITVAITGYGQTGPLAAKSGHDLNFLALSGALDLVGAPGGAPAVPGFQLADLAGGAYLALAGLLAALHERQRTGRGVDIDAGMLTGTFPLLGAALAHAFAGEAPTRGTTPLGGGLASYGVYETADGRFLSVAALEPPFWARLCERLGRPELIAEAFADAAGQAALRDTLAAVFRSAPLAHWQALFADLDVCVAPVLTVAEALAAPELAAARPFAPTPEPAEPRSVVPRLMFPLAFAGARPVATGPAPALGEHTDAVLATLGRPPAEIEALRAAGVV